MEKNEDKIVDNEPLTPEELGENINLRIGINCGAAVGAVVGETKFSYDLWSDAVNTASRMESHGEAGKIHVSEEFVSALVGTSRDLTFPIANAAIVAGTGRDLSVSDLGMHFIERGEMDIKGKGLMRTFFLEKT